MEHGVAEKGTTEMTGKTGLILNIHSVQLRVKRIIFHIHGFKKGKITVAEM